MGNIRPGIFGDFIFSGCGIRFFEPKLFRMLNYDDKEIITFKDFKDKFDYLSKEERSKIFDDLKKELVKGEKLDDNQSFDIRVFSTKEKLNGISLEIYKINELNYTELFHFSDKDYMQDSLEIISFIFEAKEERYINLIENNFQGIIPFLENIPFFKKNELKFQTRIDGKKISIDIINNNEDFYQLFCLYSDFNFCFETDMTVNEIFTSTIEELFAKVFKFKLYSNGKTKKNNYFLSSLIKIIKENNQLKKRCNKFIEILNYLKLFVSFSFDLELDYKEIVGNIIEPKNFEPLHMAIQEIINMFIFKRINMHKGLNLIDSLEKINFDEIVISSFLPKSKNGMKSIIKLPGFSKCIIDKLNKY